MFAFSIRVAKEILFSCNKLHFVKVNKHEPICSTWRLEQYPILSEKIIREKEDWSSDWVLFFCWTASEIRRFRIGRVNGWPAGVSHCHPASVPYLFLSHGDKLLIKGHFENMIRLLISQNERPIIEHKKVEEKMIV